MFTLQAVSMPPGNELFATWDGATPVRLDITQMTPIDATLSVANLLITWDFGDGTRVQGASGVRTAPDHLYASPGRYTIRAQVNADGTLTEYSWQLVLGLKAGIFGGVVGGVPRGVAALPAFHGSVVLTRGLRQFMVPLLQLATPSPTSDVGNWGRAAPSTPTIGDVAGALNTLAWQWQRAYAAGFGRLPVPAAPEPETMCWLHVPNETVAFGTSDKVGAQALAMALQLEGLLSSPGTSVFGTVAESAKRIAGVPSLADLASPNLSDSPVLAANGTSIAAADVQRWMEYSDRSTPKTVIVSSTAVATPLQSLEIQRWPEFRGENGQVQPVVDWAAAWRWLIAQAAATAADAFYQAIFPVESKGLLRDAVILVTANPATGAATLRLVSGDGRFWATAIAVRASKADARISDVDAFFEAGVSGGAFVVVQADAVVANRDGPPYLASIWDSRAVSRAIQAAAGSTYESAGNFAALAAHQSIPRSKRGSELFADGAELAMVVTDHDTNSGVARVCRPAQLLPSPGSSDGIGLEPHVRYWLASNRSGQQT